MIKPVITITKYQGHDGVVYDTLEEAVTASGYYMCPKCNGKGWKQVEYNKYPEGLPDSGWVYEAGYKKVDCELCDSVGYTEKQYKPKLVQDGWTTE